MRKVRMIGVLIPTLYLRIQGYTGPVVFLLLPMSKEINCFQRLIRSLAIKQLTL